MHRYFNIEQLRLGAQRRLPKPVFDYIDGGADDEKVLRSNTEAFGRYKIQPTVLTDVSTISTSTSLFGRKLAWPLLLSPTGLTGMFHANAERAVARAAVRHGIGYCLSTMGTTTIEEFAEHDVRPRLFQIYIFKDRGLTAEFVARAKSSGFDGLVLTADTVVTGNRERDRVNGLSIPLRLSLRSFISFAVHPRWSLPVLFGRKFDFVNVSHRVGSLGNGSTSLFRYVEEQFDRSLTWRDFEWLASIWNGPLALKGVLNAQDARRAAQSGATCVMVSNHGGRQLDDVLPPIDCIGPIADAVGGEVEIVCDGGIRRGAHILKAIALGATACSIGRPYLFGLAAEGEKGVVRALDLLRDEFERTMILAGINDVTNVDRSLIESLLKTDRLC